MADDNKAVGPLATAKLVTLIKAAMAKKYDKAGGKIDGSAEITGSLKVASGVEVSSTIEAKNYISSDLLLMAPIVALNDPSKDASVSFGVSGENAAKVTSPVSGGGTQYARLAVGAPTGDNDAATKAYVDAQLADDTYFDVYVSIADTPVSDLDIASGTYVADCAASHTYAEIKAAANAGKTPRVLIVDDVTNPGADHIICPLVGTSDNSYRFSAPNNIGVGGTAYIVITHIDNDYVLYSCSAGELPAVKDTDNGKYMLVDGGAWKAKVPPTATTTAPGLMSAADKIKLDGVATGANKTVVDAAMSDTSTNPVQAKVVKAYIDGKVAAAGSNITVDAALDAESTNPVQNKAVKAALDAAIAVRASTSAYGTTKLSNSVTSSSKTLAATPYAVKTALAQAKAYVDSSIAAAINSAY